MDKLKKALQWVHMNKIVSLAILGVIVLAIATSTMSWGTSESYSQYESPVETMGLSKSMDIGEMDFVSEESFGDAMSTRGSNEYGKIAPPIYPGEEGVYDSEVERKLVKNGSLSMTVKDIDITRSHIEQYVESVGGFVASENFNVYNTQHSKHQEDSWGKSGSLSIKVPTDTFAVSMDKIRSLALVVTNEHSNVSDVTERYTDLETRLKNKKAEEEQYRSILSKAYKISDILETTRYIEQARRDAEQLEGQLNLLSNQVKLSSISVYLESEKEVNVLGVAWDPMAQIKQGLHSLVNNVINMGNGLITFVLWIPVFLLYVVVYGFAAFVIWRIGRFAYTKIKSLLKG